MRVPHVRHIPLMIGHVAIVMHAAVQGSKAIHVALGIPIGLGSPGRENLIGQRSQAQDGGQRTLGGLNRFASSMRRE